MSFKPLAYPTITLDNWDGSAKENFERFAPAFELFIEAVNRLPELGWQKLSLELGSDNGANWGTATPCPMGTFKYRGKEFTRLHIHNGWLFENEGIESPRAPLPRASVKICLDFLLRTLKQKGLSLQKTKALKSKKRDCWL